MEPERERADHKEPGNTGAGQQQHGRQSAGSGRIVRYRMYGVQWLSHDNDRSEGPGSLAFR